MSVATRVIQSAMLALLSVSLAAGCARDRTNSELNSAPSTKQRAKDSVLGESIVDGTMFQNRLWLWSATGGLVAFDLEKQTREVIFEQGVISVRKNGDDLWILRTPAPLPKDRPPTELVLSNWRENRPVDFPRPKAANDSAVIGFSIYRGSPAIIFHDSIQILSENKSSWSSLPLRGKFYGALYRSIISLPIDDEVYAGSNFGEWGGGLQSINIATGEVHAIERRDRDEIICGGPLNSQCHPITGIIPDPQNSHCVLASVGLIHLMQDGRVLRVCGGNVEIFFDKKTTQRIDSARSIDVSEAIFGLASAPSGAVWVLGTRNLWNFVNGQATEMPLPKFESSQGLHFTRALPGVIVIATTINWSMSLSGYTSLLIPLE